MTSCCRPLLFIHGGDGTAARPFTAAATETELPAPPVQRPCGACRHLRRRCTPTCVFAPHFPPDDPKRFMVVHKAFGASNVSRILTDIDPFWRSEAVYSLVYEAEQLLRDPIHGCLPAIAFFQQQLKQLQAEIHDAKMKLQSMAMDMATNQLPACPPSLSVASTSRQLHQPQQQQIPTVEQLQRGYWQPIRDHHAQLRRLEEFLIGGTLQQRGHAQLPPLQIQQGILREPQHGAVNDHELQQQRILAEEQLRRQMSTSEQLDVNSNYLQQQQEQQHLMMRRYQEQHHHQRESGATLQIHNPMRSRDRLH